MPERVAIRELAGGHGMQHAREDLRPELHRKDVHRGHGAAEGPRHAWLRRKRAGHVYQRAHPCRRRSRHPGRGGRAPCPLGVRAVVRQGECDARAQSRAGVEIPLGAELLVGEHHRAARHGEVQGQRARGWQRGAGFQALRDDTRPDAGVDLPVEWLGRAGVEGNVKHPAHGRADHGAPTSARARHR